MCEFQPQLYMASRNKAISGVRGEKKIKNCIGRLGRAAAATRMCASFTPVDKRAAGGDRESEKKNILNNKPAGRYQYADNNPDGEGTEAPLPQGVSAGQIRRVMSLELSQSGEILNSP